MDREEKKLLLLAEGILINSLLKPLQATGCAVLATSEVDAATRELEVGGVPVAVFDLQIGAGRSLDILRKLKSESPDTLLLVLTPPWCLERAVKALEIGAETFLTTPLHQGLVRHQVERLLEKCALADENRALRMKIRGSDGGNGPAGSADGTRKGRGRSKRLRPLKEALAAPERKIILEALKACRFNRQKTAEALRINRTTLYNKMKRLRLLHLKGT